MAFIADPIVRWFIRDSARYLKYWPPFVAAFGGRAFENGTADVADNFAGVALWVPPGVGLDEAAMAARTAEALPESEHEEKFGFLGQMEEFHPNKPHWYMPLMGVDLPHIGHGLGSALLRHAIARSDNDGAPCYLEATAPLNKALYARHGFEEIGEIQFGTSPPMWPMWREPSFNRRTAEHRTVARAAHLPTGSAQRPSVSRGPLECGDPSARGGGVARSGHLHLAAIPGAPEGKHVRRATA